MRLSWNEVRARASVFSDDWKDAAYEKGETQSLGIIFGLTQGWEVQGALAEDESPTF